MIRALVAALVLCSSLIGAEDGATLEDLMSGNERSETGVETLSDSQKKALEKWLERYKEEILDDAEVEDGTARLRQIERRGAVIELDDNTKWKIFPIHRYISERWVKGNRIEVQVRNKRNTAYTHSLVNTTVSEQGTVSQKQEVFARPMK